MDKELTPKQQTSEAVRQADAVLLMTGQHPTVDQVASAVALASILRKFGKKVTTIISDDVPSGAKFLPINMVERNLGGLRDFIVQIGLDHAEVDKLKYTIEDGKLNVHVTPFSGGFQPRDVSFAYGEYQFDLVIILGVASYARLDKVYAQNADLLRKIPLVNIDFHRSNEQYGAINLIEPTAASLAEMLIALSESLQPGLIDEGIATTMLTGIMAATDRFTATHTTSKTMTVAAQMMAMGADQQKIVRNLYKSERSDKDRKNSGQGSQSQANQKKKERSDVAQPVRQEVQRQPSPVVQSVAKEAVSQAPEVNPTPVPAAQPAPIAQPPEAQPENPVQPQSPPPVASAQTEPTKPQDLPPAASAASSAPAPAPMIVPEPAPEPALEAEADAESVMEELLPPQHIELSPEQPEPLINDTSDRKPGPSQPRKPSNPTNNPIFAQRLDEFEI